MAVLPADHLISDHDQFASLLARGESAAKQWGLVTFGIKPDYPETGYGYIRRGAALPGGSYRVEQFVEKPGLEQARQFCQDGRYFWNSGMFVFQVGALQEQYRRFLPESAAVLDRLLEQNCPPLEQLYPALEAVSIDYGILEKAAGVVVVPAELAWSDLGVGRPITRLPQGRGRQPPARAGPGRGHHRQPHPSVPALWAPSAGKPGHRRYGRCPAGLPPIAPRR